MTLHKTLSVLSVLSLLASQCSAQQQAPPQTVERPHGPLLIRSYMPTRRSTGGSAATRIICTV